MRFVVTFVALATLNGLVATSASAQGVFGVDGTPIGLLSMPQYQRELKLSNDQIKQVTAATESAMNRMKENNQHVRQLEAETPGEGMKYLKAQNGVLAADYKKEIAAALKPEQLKTLRAITIQFMEGEVFRDSELRNELKLSEEQRVKMDEILAKAGTKRRDIARRLGAKETRQAALKDGAELNKSLLSDLVATLNDEQKKQWDVMLGPPALPPQTPKP